MSEPFKGGIAPTLFPTTKVGSEDSCTSIFFAVFEFVQPFRERLLKSVGRSAYKSGSDYSCLLRPSIGGRLSDKDIPDAKIVLDQKKKWTALVEVKIGSADLDAPQLGRYLNRAIEQKVDALITVSNEMCADPAMPPLRLKPAERRLRKIEHFHWSWRYIIHEAQASIRDDALGILEEKLLLQFVEFLHHEKSKVSGFHSMPKIWPKFVETVRDKGTPSSDDLDDVIAAWFQESADLAMILTEETNQVVVQDIASPSAELRKEEAEALFDKSKDFIARFVFPNRNYLLIALDVDGRCFRFETEHSPSTRVKSPHKQIERFLEGFVSVDSPDEWGDHSDVRLFAKWKRKRTETDISMSDLLVDLHEGTIKDSPFILPESDLKSLLVRYTPSGAAKEMRSAKKTIEFLEEQAVYFVETYVSVN